MLSFLKKNKFSLEDLTIVRCDGTNVNTGWKNGVIRQIEICIGRLLQRSICLLHFIELPFRHMFQHVDGATTGPI